MSGVRSVQSSHINNLSAVNSKVSGKKSHVIYPRIGSKCVFDFIYESSEISKPLELFMNEIDNPYPVSTFYVIANEGKLYNVGGYSSDASDDRNRLIFETRQLTIGVGKYIQEVKKKNELFYPRFHHSVCVHKDRYLIITGGYSNNFCTKAEV